MGFDPSQPFEAVADQTPSFDPAQPHEVIAPGFDPTQPFEAVADQKPAFDPTQPHEVLPKSEAERSSDWLKHLRAAAGVVTEPAGTLA
jgi:hypothetical protein